MILNFLFSFLFLPQVNAQTYTLTTDQQKIETLTEACLNSRNKDPVCLYIITLKQIGDDSIEAVKEYIKLGPYEYYALTAANFALTGRVRFKAKTYLDPGGTYVFDYKKDQYYFFYQREF